MKISETHAETLNKKLNKSKMTCFYEFKVKVKINRTFLFDLVATKFKG